MTLCSQRQGLLANIRMFLPGFGHDLQKTLHISFPVVQLLLEALPLLAREEPLRGARENDLHRPNSLGCIPIVPV